jgi:hypothetical protein
VSAEICGGGISLATAAAGFSVVITAGFVLAVITCETVRFVPGKGVHMQEVDDRLDITNVGTNLPLTGTKRVSPAESRVVDLNFT